jgi:hypothetical protein
MRRSAAWIFRRLRSEALVSLGLLGALGLAGTAPAGASTVTFQLTTCFISTGCPTTGPYATVTVSSVNPDEVAVTLTLAPGEVFNIAGGNGSGKPLLFDLSGGPSVPPLTISNLTAPFTFVNAPMTMADGSGKWDYLIECTNTAACGTGTSKALSGPISFDLSLSTGISPASFVQNKKSLYFAADIGIPTGGGNYTTGDVGAPPAAPIPLPPPALLLGSALLAACALARRRPAVRFALSP